MLSGTTMTDADGVYLFDSLPNGTYNVVIQLGPDGGMTPSSVSDATDADEAVQNGTPQPDGSVASEPFDLMSGTEPVETNTLDGDDQDADNDLNGNMTIDFGFIPTMSLGSTVFYDVDDSGDQDAGNPLESGIAGATVNLYYDANGDGTLDATELMTPIATTMTDDNGDYLFDSLATGFYQVGVLAPGDAIAASTTQAVADDNGDGLNDGAQALGAGAGIESLSGPVELTPGDEPQGGDEAAQGGKQDDTAPLQDENGNMTVDFGFIPTNSVGSTVFFDMNDKGDLGRANDIARVKGKAHV